MENLDPPPPQKIKDGKMARFCPSRGFILDLGGGDGGLLFHFILSKIAALKQSVPLCYVINLCLKGNVEHKLHLLRVESRMRLLTVNHFNFIAANQVLRRLKDVFGGGGYELPPISATVKLCYTFGLKWHSFLPPHCLDPLQKNSFIGVIHNSVAERSARRTRNPVVPGSRPALAT